MTLLEVRDLTAGYGRPRSSMACPCASKRPRLLLSSCQWRGKTTTMRAIAGLIGRKGTSISMAPPSLPFPDKVVAAGVSLVPQGRGTFAKLSVDDNLHVAQQNGATARALRKTRTLVRVFPVLASRRKQMAGTLSGGEQQMLAVARAL